MAQKQGTTKDTEVCAWAHQMHTPVTMHVGSSASALSRWPEHRAPHFPLLCGHRWHPFSPAGLLTHLPQITSRIQHWALQRINTSPCPEHQPLSWWPPGQGLFTMTPQSWEAPLWGGEAAGQTESWALLLSWAVWSFPTAQPFWPIASSFTKGRAGLADLWATSRVYDLHFFLLCTLTIHGREQVGWRCLRDTPELCCLGQPLAISNYGTPQVGLARISEASYPQHAKCNSPLTTFMLVTYWNSNI